MLRALIVTCLAAAPACAQDLAPVPNASNLREWMEFVQPKDQELSYRKIGWRNSLWPAVLEARQLGRPLLFWTMNGHPLGST